MPIYKNKKNFALIFLMCLVQPIMSEEANAEFESVKFNPMFLVGNTVNHDLTSFERGNGLAPGRYLVNIYINSFYKFESEIEFISSKSQGVSVSCISGDVLKDIGLKDEYLLGINKDKCYLISEVILGSGEELDSSKMNLNFVIPQAYLKKLANGYVPQSALSQGNSAGYINYTGSYYTNKYKANNKTTTSTFLNSQTGVNLGLWQLRNNSTLRNTNTSGTTYTNGNTYLQRAFTDIRSSILIGESSTRGAIFDSIPFRGITISSDERMLSPNQQGYAPVVRGTVGSNARIVIRQGNSVIDETSVPPGDFIIDDLYPTRNSGDLTVEITEAGGIKRVFKVPFSSVNNSLREGLSRFSVTSGDTRIDYNNAKNVKFIEGVYEQGINNELTLNAGVQIADNDYRSFSFGGVSATQLGAFGYNVNYSYFDDLSFISTSKSGWQFKLSYNATYAPTNTSLMLAAYKYSTDGFISLNDSLAKGLTPYYYIDDEKIYIRSESFRQKDRLEINLNQPLNEFGSLYLSASKQTYHEGLGHINQYQAGFQNTIGKVSYSINASREQVYASSLANKGKSQNIYSLNISVPFDFLDNKVGNLNSNMIHYGKSGNVYQNNFVGNFGENRDFTYSLSHSIESKNNINSYSINLSRDSSIGTFGGSYASQGNSSIYSVNGRGSLVAYSGGVIAGPYVSETFAIIEAEGAEGAILTSTNGVKINRFGMAIIPSLSAYRFNNVNLDPKNMSTKVELNETQKKIAPYAGAIPVIRFNTKIGHAILMDVKTSKGEYLPVGAIVTDYKGNDIGIVGQGSQVYIRVPEIKGKVTINFDTSKKCIVNYNLEDNELNSDLIYLKGVCV